MRWIVTAISSPPAPNGFYPLLVTSVGMITSSIPPAVSSNNQDSHPLAGQLFTHTALTDPHPMRQWRWARLRPPASLARLPTLAFTTFFISQFFREPSICFLMSPSLRCCPVILLNIFQMRLLTIISSQRFPNHLTPSLASGDITLVSEALSWAHLLSSLPLYVSSITFLNNLIYACGF